jgi:DNA polymerase-3 subunit epsilon
LPVGEGAKRVRYVEATKHPLYDLRLGGHAVHLPCVRGRTDVCGCFPTGRHYPGIADLIAEAIQNVEGLCQEFEPGASWEDIPITVIDFETTGRDSETDRVIEIGLVTFEKGKVSSRESWLVNPGIPVPEESRAVHGITDEELEGAPDFATVMPRLLELLQGKLPVAYNVSFDRGFLLTEIARAAPKGMTPGDMPPAARDDVVWVDPLVWAREILKELQSRRLGDVAKHLGIPLEQAHRAAGDAEATGRILLALAPQLPRIYGELVRLQKRYAAFQDAEFAAWKRFR